MAPVRKGKGNTSNKGGKGDKGGKGGNMNKRGRLDTPRPDAFKRTPIQLGSIPMDQLSTAEGYMALRKAVRQCCAVGQRHAQKLDEVMAKCQVTSLVHQDLCEIEAARKMHRLWLGSEHKVLFTADQFDQLIVGSAKYADKYPDGSDSDEEDEDDDIDTGGHGGKNIESAVKSGTSSICHSSTRTPQEQMVFTQEELEPKVAAIT